MSSGTVTSLDSASLSRRIIAFFIDMLLISIFGWLCVTISNAILGGDNRELFRPIGTIATVAYFIGFHQSIYQATPGKMLSGIRLVRTNGKEKVDLFCSATRYFILYLGAFISLALAIATGDYQKPPDNTLKPHSKLKSFSATQEKILAEGEEEPTNLDRAYDDIRDKLKRNEPLTEKEQRLWDALDIQGWIEFIKPNSKGSVEYFSLFLLGVMLLSIMYNKKNVGLHDIVAGTMVVNDPNINIKNLFGAKWIK